MTRPAIEVADIVRRRGKQFLERFKAVLSYQQLKAYRAVERCRTAALGGHKDTCEDCAYEAPFSYNSCRSRCCPKCQAQARRRWLQIQQRDLLNTSYFHVVFTLPHELNPLALTSRKPLLELLFDASSQTLLEAAADPQRLGAEIGFLSILHTWGSNLLPHYHIHAVVPGGGLSADHQRWIHTSHPMFLLPVPVLRTAFRTRFLDGLRQLYRKDQLDCCGPASDFRDPRRFEQLIEKLGSKKWYGGYKLQMQQNRFGLIYSTAVAGAVGKWEAQFAFHFSMARRGKGSWPGALADVCPVVGEVESAFWQEQFGGSFPAECLSRSGVEFPCDLIELFLGKQRQVGSLRQVLAE